VLEMSVFLYEHALSCVPLPSQMSVDHGTAMESELRHPCQRIFVQLAKIGIFLSAFNESFVQISSIFRRYKRKQKWVFFSETNLKRVVISPAQTY